MIHKFRPRENDGFAHGKSTKSKSKEKTTFEKWNDGEVSGFGSFHTSLLKTFQLGSTGNKERLRKAFPEWFGNKKIQ